VSRRPAPTRLLLLDYNGVIANDEPLHYAALRDVLAVERIALDEAAYAADYLGLDDPACLREAFRHAGRPLEPAAVHRLAARKADWYAELVRAGLPLVPGVGEFARAAATGMGLGLAVVSGALRREVAAGLQCAGIADLVRVVVSAEDVAAGKPDPAGYRRAIAQLAGEADVRVGVVVVEDSVPGLAAARAVGAGCVMLATSHSAGRLAGADLVWTSFAGHQPQELAPLFREVEVRGRA
jgi:beta-phosphoglucomutase